jgi:peptidyl-tRNA hydrolase
MIWKWKWFVAVCDFCDEQKVIFLKPKVAMNVNGRSVHKTGTVYYVPGS